MVADLRSAGEEAYPSVFPLGLYRFDDALGGSAIPGLLPLGGISRKTTVLCNETGRYMIYKSDEHGFHNPPGLWADSPADILAVGDSFTHGACVDSHESFVALLRRARPRTVSVGMSGNGPLAELAGVREYVPLLKPRLVVWCYNEGNDISDDLPNEVRIPLLTRYLEPGFSQHLAARQPEIDRRIGDWLDTLAGDVLWGTNPPRGPERFSVNLKDLLFLRGLRNPLNVLLSPRAAHMELFRTILREARRTVEANGGKLVVVNLPGYRRYVNATGRFFQVLRHDRLFAMLRDEGIPAIDVADAFDRRNDPASLFLSHYSAEGNRVVAETILEGLKEMGE